jgi:hypothetical protein
LIRAKAGDPFHSSRIIRILKIGEESRTKSADKSKFPEHRFTIVGK